MIGYIIIVGMRAFDKKYGNGSKHDPAFNLLVIGVWPIFILIGVIATIWFVLAIFSNVIELIADKIAGK